MNCKLHPLVFAAAVLSLACSLAGQSTAPAPALPPAGGAPANSLVTTTREGSIPEEFRPLDDGARPLANTVDEALEMVKKAVKKRNVEDFRKMQDTLIAGLKNSITVLEVKLEPECRKSIENAKERSREITSKERTPGLTPQQQKRWSDMAQSYLTNAESGQDVLKKIRATREELAANLKKAEAEKELLVAEMELKGLESTIKQSTQHVREAVESLKVIIQRVENTPPNEKPATSERN